MNCINNGLYIISHSITMPSKLSDYDYIPFSNKRFISTYLHKLIFSDPVTNTNELEFSFDSLTCADLISALMKIKFNFHVEMFVYLQNGILIDGIKTITRLHHLSNGDTYIESIESDARYEYPYKYEKQQNYISLGNQLDDLIDLLNSEEIDNLFVQYSSDR